MGNKLGDAGCRIEGRADRGDTSIKLEMNAGLDGSNPSVSGGVEWGNRLVDIKILGEEGFT